MILHPFLDQINKVLILLKPPITITFVVQEYASFPDGCSTVFMEAEQICRSCKSLPSKFHSLLPAKIRLFSLFKNSSRVTVLDSDRLYESLIPILESK